MRIALSITLCISLWIGASRPCAGEGGPDVANTVLADADIYDVDGSDLITVIDPFFEDDSLVGYWLAIRRYEDLPIQYYRIISIEHFDQWNISVFTVAEDLEGGGTPWWYFTESQHFSILAPLCEEDVAIRNLERLSDGMFEFEIEGAENALCVVQCSNDLIAWQTVATVETEDGRLEFEDPVPANGAFRAYRVVLP
jgi:hypothetical protein